MVFLDEPGINLAFVREYARSEKETRAYGLRPSRTKNVSVAEVISLKNGLLAHLSMLGYMDLLMFDAFIYRRIMAKLWKDTMVVMNNCKGL